MNSLWVTRMSDYKCSSLALETARKIIFLKIRRQRTLIKKYHLSVTDTKIGFTNSLEEVFMEEARMAKRYWYQFGNLLPTEVDFSGRKAGEPDVSNKLLDIGYHHLMNEVKKILGRLNVSTELGLLHRARTSDSHPLVYDLVEMFRADIVDAEVLRFLRLKKKFPIKIEEEVGHFLHEVNERLERKYFLKDFDTCHTYRYYMEVQILKFIKAVNHKEIFVPLMLPLRHETRCIDNIKV